MSEAEDEDGSRRRRNHDGPLNKDTLSLVCFCVAIIVLGEMPTN